MLTIFPSGPGSISISIPIRIFYRLLSHLYQFVLGEYPTLTQEKPYI